MPDAASNRVVGIRRAQRLEEHTLNLGLDGLPIFCTSFGEQVEFRDGDQVGIDHIPAKIDRRLGLDGLEYAIVEGPYFRFPYHRNVRYLIAGFADMGITVTLSEHAEVKVQVFDTEGDSRYVYVDPIQPDPFGSAYEGC
jgi:hypothetical protein